VAAPSHTLPQRLRGERGSVLSRRRPLGTGGGLPFPQAKHVGIQGDPRTEGAQGSGQAASRYPGVVGVPQPPQRRVVWGGRGGF
jgi:hypothetical protein